MPKTRMIIRVLQFGSESEWLVLAIVRLYSIRAITSTGSIEKLYKIV